ncbi:MAG: DNA methyltransferase [Planctomycetota bacterium]|jgi:DNA modification methylase
MKIRDRIKEFRRVPAGKIKPNPKNWRTHPPAQREALKGILEEVGYADALLVREMPDGSLQLIDGHLRAETTPDMSLPVLVLDLDDEEADKLLASLDPLAGLAGTDPDKLGELLSDLATDSAALQGMFDELRPPVVKDGLTDPDAVPEPPEEPVTKPGDLWLLGDHRLLCGDSSKDEDVDRLLDGAPVHLVNTDPPYNVKVEPRSNNAIAAGLSSFQAQHHQQLDVARHPEKSKPTHRQMRPKDRPLENDFVSDEEFERLLHAWFGNVARTLLPGRAFYIWGGYANCGNYPPVLKALDLYFSQAIIWIKEHPVLTRKDFMGNHEWCFYGWRKGAGHQFFGPPNVADVWSVKKVNPQAMVHLTEKPVELAVRAMEYSSRAGENVLDLFGGSGSTLIAAEQTGRKAFLMEVDPAYCDVMTERWKRFTGEKGERVST